MKVFNRFSRVSKAALLLLVFFAIDKVVAILRQVLTARVFGLSAELDAFNAANNLPDLLFALISGGALAIAFIPVLSEVITSKGSQESWKLFSRIANLAFVVTAILGILVGIFAEQLVGWRLGIAPGFHTSQQQLVAELMRLNLVATLLFSISGLVMAGLQANQHFLLPALAPILYNFGQIFGASILAPETPMHIGPIQLPALGLGIHGLVYGVILGAVLHLLIQVPGLIRYKFIWVGDFGLHTDEVRKVLRLLGPRLLTMLFIQLIFIARDNLASGLGTGAVSALTYGWMLMQVPETLIGTALGTALLPTLAEYATRQDWESFWQAIQRSTRYLIALNIPVAVILSLGLGPLVSLAFGFDAAGTQLVMLATTGYLAGLLSHSLIEVGARAFYSRQNAILPLLASLLTGIAFVLFGIGLSRLFGAPGIAWATSIAFTIEMLFLFYLLVRTMARKLEVGHSLLRSLAAAVLAGVITWFLPHLFPFPAWISAILAMVLAFCASFVLVLRDVKTIVAV
jgi:putative peptidoglycan lipid II flippase